MPPSSIEALTWLGRQWVMTSPKTTYKIGAWVVFNLTLSDFEDEALLQELSLQLRLRRLFSF